MFYYKLKLNNNFRLNIIDVNNFKTYKNIIRIIDSKDIAFAQNLIQKINNNMHMFVLFKEVITYNKIAVLVYTRTAIIV